MPRLLAAFTGDAPGRGSALGKQDAQGRRSGVVQAGAQRHFQGFQVQRCFLPPSLEHYLEKRLDLSRDFLMNSRSRFFSSSVQPASWGSAGRRRQIRWLSAVNSEISA